ncbi:MAG: hypothetical protein IJK98_02820 [Clostridia bacterium]|nr:hypothetical protein [Clostridia bacterium]
MEEKESVWHMLVSYLLMPFLVTAFGVLVILSYFWECLFPSEWDDTESGDITVTDAY